MQPDHVQELLAALSARIETCVEHGDASGVLEASALDEAGELWLALQLEPEPQLEALYILAFLHWCRYQALPEGLDHEDGAAALRFFEMVGRTRPDLVPPDVARVLGTSAPPRGGPGEDPASVFNRGVLLFNEFRATGQRPAIDQALALFHQAANRIPPGPPPGTRAARTSYRTQA